MKSMSSMNTSADERSSPPRQQNVRSSRLLKRKPPAAKTSSEPKKTRLQGCTEDQKITENHHTILQKVTVDDNVTIRDKSPRATATTNNLRAKAEAFSRLVSDPIRSVPEGIAASIPSKHTSKTVSDFRDILKHQSKSPTTSDHHDALDAEIHQVRQENEKLRKNALQDYEDLRKPSDLKVRHAETTCTLLRIENDNLKMGKKSLEEQLTQVRIRCDEMEKYQTLANTACEENARLKADILANKKIRHAGCIQERDRTGSLTHEGTDRHSSRE